MASVLKPLDGWGAFRTGSRPAAVTLLLHELDGELHVPFVLRRPDLPDHPGQVALPGGTVKPGEDAWAAAAREVQEEIGVAAASLHPAGSGGMVYTSVTNFSVVSFVALVAGPDVRFAHDPGELVGILQVPLARLLDETAWLAHEEEWRGSYFDWEGSTIWGLTQRVLNEVLPRLREVF